MVFHLNRHLFRCDSIAFTILSQRIHRLLNGRQIGLSVLGKEVHTGVFAVPDHLFDDGAQQAAFFLQRGRIHRAGKGFDHFLMEGKLLMEHLSTLTEGDEVILTTLWGEDHYRVSGVAVIAPDDIASVMIQPGKIF